MLPCRDGFIYSDILFLELQSGLKTGFLIETRFLGCTHIIGADFYQFYVEKHTLTHQAAPTNLTAEFFCVSSDTILAFN
ncbi:MAG: hypothetical protein VKK42_08080 [Lyngbya sp.]|nr:hypothetical protein [Lyngbya sp.]